MADIVFRTTDGTRWGPGKGANLTATEVDLNFWYLYFHLQDLIANPPTAVEISDFRVVGSQFFVDLSDHTTYGPFELPVAKWNPRGTWQPSTPYVTNDVFDIGGSLYLTIFDHTSGLTFDAGANDGMGHDYYALLLAFNTTVDPPPINTTSASLTTILAHAGQYIRCNSPTGTTVTVLLDSTVNHAVGTVIEYRLGVSGFSMVFFPETSDSPVINYPDDDFLLEASKKGAVVALKKVGNNEWDAFGLLDPII